MKWSTATESAGALSDIDRHQLAVRSIGVAVTAATALFAVREGADDAYIVFRYVLRWLSGQGLTFNDGEAVEGFTSLSWVIVLAVITRLTGLPVASVSILVNYVLLLVTVVLLERALRTAGASITARAMAVGVFATSFPYFQMAFLGLELGLFGLLLIVFGAFACSVLQEPASGGRGAVAVVALGVVGGLLAATRPEAVAVFPLLIAAVYLPGCHRRPDRAALVTSFVGYAAIAGGVFLWRWLQYGDWLPNSVIAKSISLEDPRLSNVIEQRVRDGITYLLEAYATYPAFATVSTVALLLGVARALSRRSVVLLVPLVLAHAVAVENGGDWMPQFRLLSMYWPLWIFAGWSVLTDLYRRHQRFAFAAIVVGLLLHGWSTTRAILAVEDVPVEASLENGWPKLTVADDASFNGFSFAYEEVGRALRHVWIPGDVLAAESVGRLGYVAPELFIHDPMGLTDRTLAHDRTAFQNVYGRMNWRYTMGLEPAIVLLHFWPHQRDWATYGISYPEQFERYCLQPPFDEDDPFTLYIIVRRDRPGYSTALRHIGVRPLDTANGHVGCPIRSRVK